jgi:hypothetical protein
MSAKRTQRLSSSCRWLTSGKTHNHERLVAPVCFPVSLPPPSLVKMGLQKPVPMPVWVKLATGGAIYASNEWFLERSRESKRFPCSYCTYHLIQVEVGSVWEMQQASGDGWISVGACFWSNIRSPQIRNRLIQFRVYMYENITVKVVPEYAQLQTQYVASNELSLERTR